MLAFFRKIRKSIIESGSARKYLLYAIGEILLVVIGILIALQINNWNEWKKDRVREKEILSDLAETFELNIESLEEDIAFLQVLSQSSRVVLSALHERLPFHDSLARHFHLARVPKHNLVLSLSGYEQYKNKGYDIILNKRVRDEIVAFFESAYPKWIRNYSMVNDHYVPFIDHVVPLFIYTSESLVPIDMESLYDDQYYLGWVRAYMEGRYTLVDYETGFVGENQRILQLLRDELGSK